MFPEWSLNVPSQLRRQERQFELHRRTITDSHRRVNELKQELKISHDAAMQAGLRANELEGQIQRSVNIEGTFRSHSGNIQGTFREHSVNIQ